MAYTKKSFKQMLGLFEEMKDKNVPYDRVTYNWLLSAFEMNQQPSRCIMVLNEMEEKDMATSQSYSVVMKSLISSGSTDKVLDVYNQMKERERKPDVLLLNYLIDFCASSANIELALKVYEDFELNNLHPTIETFNSMISTITQGKDSNLSLEWLKKAQVELAPLVTSKMKYLLNSFGKSNSFILASYHILTLF